MRLLLIGLWLVASSALALDAATVGKLGFGDGDEKIAAIAALVAEGDPAAAALLQAAMDGELQTSGKLVLVVKGEEAVNAATGAKVSPLPEDREDVILNNRVRRELDGAMAALKLISPDRAARLAAAKELSGNADAAMLPLVQKALARETDVGVKQLLELTQATLELKTGTKESRIGAVRTPRCCCWRSSRDPRRATTRSPTKTSAPRRRRACGRWKAGSPGASAPACCSPACRWARSCCLPRSASPSPTG
jgi:urea transport system permease protein